MKSMEYSSSNTVTNLSFHGKNNTDILSDLFSIAENVHKGSAQVSISVLNVDVGLQYKISSLAKEPDLFLCINKANYCSRNELSFQNYIFLLDNLFLLIKSIIMGFAFISNRSALEHEIHAPHHQIFALISYDILKVDNSQKGSEDTDYKNFTDTISGNPDVLPDKIDFIVKLMHQKKICGSPKRVYQKKYRCKYCKVNFWNIKEKEKHEYTHLKERPLLCGFCTKAFTTKFDKDNHERKHTDKKPYACNSCGQKFSLITRKQSHERSYCSHNKVRKSVEKSTPNCKNKVYRQMHEQTNISSRRYECNYCEKSFFFEVETKSHVKFHKLQLKSTLCSICKKCLSTWDIVNICNRYPIISCRENFVESCSNLSHDRKDMIKTSFICKYCSRFCEIIKYNVNPIDKPSDFVQLNVINKGFNEKSPTIISENRLLLPVSNVAFAF